MTVTSTSCLSVQNLKGRNVKVRTAANKCSSLTCEFGRTDVSVIYSMKLLNIFFLAASQANKDIGLSFRDPNGVDRQIK